VAGLAGIPGVILRIRDGVPYVLTEHGILVREVYASMSSSAYPDTCRAYLVAFHRAVAAVNYHFADIITSLGEFNTKWQVRFGADPEKIRYLPNGVDPDRFPHAPEPSGTPLVLTLARIYPLKGITTLLEAAAIVRQFVPDVRFRILGEVADGPYFEECQAIVKRHRLEATVEFGATADPGAEYRKAWLCCLPSLSEAMPYVLLEAMLSGCPVVATDVGNVAETLGGCGALARPNSPDDLAAKIVPLLRGQDAAARRRAMTAAGLRRGQSFTTDAATTRFRNLYQELLECQHQYQAF
jgi:glycosyltransferase involved in cell wall biosynthesis